MFIAETFTSLQGEGMLVGVPSYFIRTSGCNLRCRWCDTPHTSWLAEGERRVVAALMAEVEACSVEHVVITGGEPLLQREIGVLTRRLKGLGKHVTVETAGTVDPDFECDLLSLSPKTASSDPQGAWRDRHLRQRSELAPSARLLARFPDHQLKFVVQDGDDLREILELIEAVGRVESARVRLMAAGRSAAEVAEKASAVAALCADHCFSDSPRLHLDLFGGGSGV